MALRSQLGCSGAGSWLRSRSRFKPSQGRPRRGASKSSKAWRCAGKTQAGSPSKSSARRLCPCAMSSRRCTCCRPAGVARACSCALLNDSRTRWLPAGNVFSSAGWSSMAWPFHRNQPRPAEPGAGGCAGGVAAPRMAGRPASKATAGAMALAAASSCAGNALPQSAVPSACRSSSASSRRSAPSTTCTAAWYRAWRAMSNFEYPSPSKASRRSSAMRRASCAACRRCRWLGISLLRSCHWASACSTAAWNSPRRKCSRLSARCCSP